MRLLVSCIPYDGGKSGISVYVREVVAALKDQGHELTLLCEPAARIENVECKMENVECKNETTSILHSSFSILHSPFFTSDSAKVLIISRAFKNSKKSLQHISRFEASVSSLRKNYSIYEKE